MADDFLATAFVEIKPSTKGFESSLRKQVKNAVGRVVATKVNIAPSTKGFAARLRTEVRDAIAKSGRHSVPITPVLTTFRRQLQQDLTQKPIPVTVQPIQKAARVGKSGATEAAAAEKALTAEEKKAIAAEAALADTRKSRIAITTKLREVDLLLKEATRQGISVAQQDILLTRAQSISRQALLDVTLRQASAEGILRQEQLKLRAVQAGQSVERIIAGLEAESLAREKADAAVKLERAEKEKLTQISSKLAVAEEKVTTAVRSALPPTEKLAVLSSELTRIQSLERNVAEQLVAAQSALTTSATTQNQLRVQGLTTLQAETAALNQNIKANLNKITANAQAARLDEIQKKIRIDIAAATQVEVSSLKTLDAVKKQDIALTTLQTEVQAGLKIARTLGIVSIERELVGTEALIKARLGELAATKKQIAAAVELAAAQKIAARGGLATFLALLGARGATLAAGSEFLIGAAAVTAFAKSIKDAARLQQELNVFAVTAGALGDQMERVREEALALGADITLPAVGASDAAQAMTDLAKAGLSVQDSLDGARGVLQLATAAQIENAQATELVASGLNAFGLAGIQATHVADLLTGAANEAQGSITDMGIALQQSSAVARQAGLSLENTVAFITLLAQSGIRGSDAGTSLRTALLRLIAPTQEASKELKKLGVQVLDSAGNVRPEVFSDLNKELSELDARARNQTLRKIFGQDAIRAAVIFGREGTAGLEQVRQAISEQGLASELAGARTKGFSGSIEALKNNIGTLSSTLGTFALGPLKIVVDSLSDAISSFNTLAGAILKVQNAIADLVDQTSNLQIGPIDVDLRKPTKKVLEFGKRFLGPQAGFVFSVNLAGDTFDAVRGQLVSVKTVTQQAREEVKGIIADLQQPGGTGPTALNTSALAVTDLIRKLQKGPPEAQKFALELQKLLANIQNADTTLPPFKFPKVEIPPEFQTGEFGSKIIEPSLNTLRESFPALFNIGEGMTEALADGIDSGTPGVVDKFKNLIPKITTTILDLQEEFSKGEVSGTRQGQKSNLQRQIDEQQRIVNEANRQIANLDISKPGGPTALKPLKDQRRAANAQIASLTEQIRGIEADAAADIKKKADDIATKQKESAAALIRLFGIDEQKALNKESIAAQNEGLRDDLVADKLLLAVYKKQRALASKQLKDKEALRDFLEDVDRKIFAVTLEIANDKKALNEKLKQNARDQRDKVLTGIELDIELAEINENKGAEIRHRRRLIKALEDKIKHEKGNTNLIKELQNEIARQRQAIKEATGEQKEKNNDFAELSFEFLQQQQGFAANLLGNLIPMGASGGLVGGTSLPPGGGQEALFESALTSFKPGLSPKGGVTTQDAIDKASGGPTRGGQSRELALLERIATLLTHIKNGTGHPETKHQRNQHAGGSMNYLVE